MSNDAYFTGKSGAKHYYADIAARLRKDAPHTLGKHISVQLEAIGLTEEMINGTTPCGLPFTFTEATCSPTDPANAPLIIRSGETTAAAKIVVPAGSPLIAGRLYLQLYHGRNDPAQQMDDWGFAGPTFGPLTSVVQTYLTHFRLYGDGGMELWLETCDDMIVWQGSYYGDMSVFIATPDTHARSSSTPLSGCVDSLPSALDALREAEKSLSAMLETSCRELETYKQECLGGAADQETIEGWQAEVENASTTLRRMHAALASIPSGSAAGTKPYSVLLLYPDDVNDSGAETYYAFVEATDAIEAVAVARREAVAAQEEAAADYEPDDFAPLLVIAGHHYGQPMSNQ